MVFLISLSSLFSADFVKAYFEGDGFFFRGVPLRCGALTRLFPSKIVEPQWSDGWVGSVEPQHRCAIDLS